MNWSVSFLYIGIYVRIQGWAFMPWIPIRLRGSTCNIREIRSLAYGDAFGGI
jgi:hypothetical protein